MLLICLLATLLEVTFSINSVLEDADTFTSEFQSIVGTPHFVDKSLLIKTFFAPKGWGFLITAPRRFGKSTNMNMIMSFCEVQVFLNGSRIPKKDAENYTLFTGKYNKVEDSQFLDVYKDKEFFNKHFCQYPVIYLDFKLLSANSFNSFIESFRNLVVDEYRRHQYLLNSNNIKLRPFRIIRLNKYYGKIVDKNLSENDLVHFIKFLPEMLFIHFEKRVIVLIDEYDAPIHEAIFESGNDIDRTIKFIRKFISKLLKSNKFVEKALLNACVRLSGISTTDANNIVHYPFGKNHPFTSYYGFTLEEVKGLAKKFDVTDEMAGIEAWYDGYSVAGSDLKLLNTFSIVNYFCSRVFDNYWVKSGYIKNLENIVLRKGITSVIESIIKGDCTRIIYPKRIEVKHIEKLRDIVRASDYDELDDNDVDLFLSFMLDLGYLTVISQHDNHFTVKAPNKEVKVELKEHLHSVAYFSRKLNVNKEDVESYLDSLRYLGSNEESYKEFARAIMNLFTHVEMPENEAELKDPLAAFPRFRTKLFGSYSEVSLKTDKKDTRRRSIHNYIDILIIRYEDKTGIILEIKYDNKLRMQKFSASEAHKQIIDKKYFNIFNTGQYNVSDKINVGVLVKKEDKKTGKPQCIVNTLYNSVNLTDSIKFTINKI